MQKGGFGDEGLLVRDNYEFVRPPSEELKKTVEDTQKLVEGFYERDNHPFFVADTTQDLKALALQIYLLNERQVWSIAQRYKDLSAAHTEEDLMQEAFLALRKALANYKEEKRRSMKFANWWYWWCQKQFAKVIGSGDKVVEVYDENGEFLETIEYPDYQKQKKALVRKGCSTNVTGRQMDNIEDFLRLREHADETEGKGEGEDRELRGKGEWL